MKTSFLYLFNEKTQRTLYVVHQINEKNSSTILNTLHENDILFFDDCLYSQYLFLKKYNNVFILKHIYCVLSFSTNIYRRSGNPVEYAICAECHDRFHNGDMTVLQCYMSLDEISLLLTNDNIYLACHGHNHLLLEKLTSDKLCQTKLFSDDINHAASLLNLLNGLKTNIFVFPYAYDDFPLSEFIIKKYYSLAFANKHLLRIDIDEII